MNEKEIATRKNGIDLFKLIAAYFVMVLHADDARLSAEYAENARLLGRWAVPFFFMSAGFFLGHKIEKTSFDFKKIQKNVSMLISIMIVAALVFLVAGFFKESYYYRIEDLLIGTHYHLWFIGSLLFGYVFIWYLYFIKKESILAYLSILLFALALLSDSYDLFLWDSFHFSFFRFLLSIPFMFLGIFLSKKKINPKYKGMFLLLAIGGIGLQLIEAQMFKSLFDYSAYSHQFLLGTILMVVPLFIFSSLLNIQESKLSRWGREYSIFIYLYHPLLYLFVMPGIENNWPFIQGFSPIIGFLICLSFAMTLHKFLPRVYNVLKGNFNG